MAEPAVVVERRAGLVARRAAGCSPELVEAALREHERDWPPDSPAALKVVPGPTRVTMPVVDGRPVCVKEYRGEPLALRLKHLLPNLLLGRPARRSFDAAARLGAAAPAPLAAVTPAWPLSGRSSFFLSEGLAGSLGADRYALERLNPADRRAFARALGAFFRRLHARGVWHRDLKATNIRVTERGKQDWAFHVVDLDRVRFLRRLSPRRRARNLAQIHHSMPRALGAANRLRFFLAYLDADRLDADAKALARAALAEAGRRAKGGA